MTEFCTPRLLLRHWREEDREPWAALGADAEVMRHFPAPLSRAESDAFVDRVGGELEERGWGLWAVEELATGRFLGFTGLNVPRFEARFLPATEIGWRFRRDAWGRGYASEAARGALTVAFDDLGLDEVVSFTATTNTRSEAVMRRIGMTRDPAEDFDHPELKVGSPLRRHVLYRLRRPAAPL
ncbi:GNAT family N-acetyltransferase [uncultured Amnibacterium sp.]|uniref:GNAT family N-acetyltransferase n=1 Tax=uncultured Amnibacterium sp. TaxID=1631851 RepID=UPI0035CB27A3